MDPNRRAQERERAAERKAAELIAKAERSARSARRRGALIRDALIAIIVALILYGAWKSFG